jgi:hypothetical protein
MMRIKNNTKKAQVSMEFILATGFMMLLLLIVILMTNSLREDVSNYENTMALKAPCDYISGMINNVYAMGSGTRVTDSLEYNITILGKTRQVLVWKKIDRKNLTFYCSFVPFNVTNAYVTGFTIPDHTNFTIENIDGNIEIRDAALDNGVEAWFRMDSNDSMGNITDSTESGFNGIIKDILCGPAVTGHNGNACNFVQNHDQYINLTNATVPYSKEITVSAWIKHNSLVSSATVVCKSYDYANFGDGWCMDFGGSGNEHLRFSVFKSNYEYTCESVNNLASNRWYMVTATVNASHINVYADGNLNKSCQFGVGDLPPNTLDIIIGSKKETATTGYIKPFDGIIDDVRIYGRSLYPYEVKRLYDAYFNYVIEHPDQYPR